MADRKRHPGMIEGRGKLIVAGEEVGPTDYRVAVQEAGDEGAKKVMAILYADLPILKRAYEAGDCTLALAEGQEVSITIKSLSGTTAQIFINDPLPEA